MGRALHTCRVKAWKFNAGRDLKIYLMLENKF